MLPFAPLNLRLLALLLAVLGLTLVGGQAFLRHYMATLRRTRILLLSLLLLGALGLFGLPGLTIHVAIDALLAPVSIVLVMLALVSGLFFGSDASVVAQVLQSWLQPLRWLGLPVASFARRLALTLAQVAPTTQRLQSAWHSSQKTVTLLNEATSDRVTPLQRLLRCLQPLLNDSTQ